MINYEQLLRGVEQDIKNAKTTQHSQLVHQYEKVEEKQIPLTRHQLEDDYYEKVAQRVATQSSSSDANLDDDDDDELDERELRAYLLLKKAQKVLQQKEDPNQLASALLRSNEKVFKREALEQKLEQVSISQHLPWIHTITLHSFKNLEVKNHEDDLERELAFYNQALLSANEAVSRLTQQNIPCIRPDDYFAEMVKSDEHMLKIRDKLLYSKKVIEAREARRKQREQKKLGKKIQVAKLQEKLEEKKANLEAIKMWKKKSAGKEFDIDDLEKSVQDVKQGKLAAAGGSKGGGSANSGAGGGKKSFGGQKGAGAKKSGGGGVQKPNKRLGKNRRAQDRSKRK